MRTKPSTQIPESSSNRRNSKTAPGENTGKMHAQMKSGDWHKEMEEYRELIHSSSSEGRKSPKAEKPYT